MTGLWRNLSLVCVHRPVTSMIILYDVIFKLIHVLNCKKTIFRSFVAIICQPIICQTDQIIFHQPIINVLATTDNIHHNIQHPACIPHEKWLISPVLEPSSTVSRCVWQNKAHLQEVNNILYMFFGFLIIVVHHYHNFTNAYREFNVMYKGSWLNILTIKNMWLLCLYVLDWTF